MEFLLQANGPSNQGKVAKACQQRSVHERLCVGSNVQIGISSNNNGKSTLDLRDKDMAA